MATQGRENGVGEVEVADGPKGNELFAEVLRLDGDEGEGEAKDGVTYGLEKQ